MMDTRWDFIGDGSLGAESVLACASLDETPFSEWLMSMMERCGRSRRETIRASRLNQTFAYQIISGQRRASRDKLIQLAFGMGFELETACELLERGGVSALLPWQRRDVIIACALRRRMSLVECDDLLWDMGERTIMPQERGGVFIAGP